MRVKTNLNAILTTMAGGVPITEETSDRALNKLLEQNRELNAHLPYFESGDMTRAEVLEQNRLIKSEALLEKLPELKSMMADIVFEGKELDAILKKEGKITDDYVLRAKKLLLMAQKRIGTKNIILNFEDQSER